MGYCPSCGAHVEDDAYACASCGKVLKVEQKTYVNDTGGFGWGLLGFCIPLVGLILYLVWRDEKPATANAAGLGALLGFIISFIGGIIIGLSG